ncbi:Mu transposase domain-containing protein [Candidatus Mycobacterium methanotrophicum]|uniref:IS21 family transposase n=1 Tax=Candidatus Mycobacterium methanotrophicum TaxID=2943498 RepID=A0ABY4QRV9_9MYCO|nr:IS21 family transposase [Candidatus Mycobacterium methanotrophicum]UQX13634.1 IS21 family transposase [Candidatus Mycobacterium methanotrophicum]
MLTWEDDVEVHALRKRGWSISAIARHAGRDRKTIRGYLSGERTPGVRARPSPDGFGPFIDYVTARLGEDPHLWARTLCDELEELGFALSYQSLTRNIRDLGLRPDCAVCRGATERPNAIIAHEPGDETQWDWLDLPNPPQSWGWGRTAHLLVGSLAHSAKWRGWLSPRTQQPHLVEGLDLVTRALGGVTRTWRFDRMATVCDPATGRITASFAGVAKHYGVSVAICPPRRGNRKGVVEKANLTAAQRWWRTMADEVTPGQVQADLDRFCSTRADTRMRATPDGKSTVAAVAEREPLAAVPVTPYPVIIAEQRTASRQALVSYRGNRYSVPPELAMAQVTVTHPLGGEFIDIAASSGIVVARHRRLADGLGATVRDGGHVIALDAAAMATANTGRPHRRKERIPPGAAALAAAAELRKRIDVGGVTDVAESATTTTTSTVIDLSVYERAAQQRSTLK